MVRVFVAVDLPDALRAELADVQTGFSAEKMDIRWVKPSSIHLTLAFLGDVPSAGLDSIFLAVAKAAEMHAPIHLAGCGLGVFPGIKRPRVVWAGLSGELDSLARLRTCLVHGLAEIDGLNYRVEKRPFRAHLTIGRAKGRLDPRKLTDAMERFQGLPAAPLTVDTIHVFKSDLTPGGASYSKLYSIRLTSSR